MIENYLWGIVKNVCGQTGLWTLKLTVCQERSDGTSFWAWLTKNEHGQKGCGQSGDGTLKLTVFEEWTDGIYKLIFCMLIYDHKN